MKPLCSSAPKGCGQGLTQRMGQQLHSDQQRPRNQGSWLVFGWQSSHLQVDLLNIFLQGAGGARCDCNMLHLNPLEVS